MRLQVITGSPPAGPMQRAGGAARVTAGLEQDDALEVELVDLRDSPSRGSTPDHAPAFTGDPTPLDTLRAVFPGPEPGPRTDA